MSQDNSNIFSKILDGEIPSQKIFETEHSLAILDAFPCANGHALLLPKKKGQCDLSEMDASDQSNYMADLPLLIRKVKFAASATSVNIISNAGPDSGQTVFHPHIHVIPRQPGDKVVTHPTPLGGMVQKEKAEEILEKMGNCV